MRKYEGGQDAITHSSASPAGGTAVARTERSSSERRSGLYSLRGGMRPEKGTGAWKRTAEPSQLPVRRQQGLAVEQCMDTMYSVVVRCLAYSRDRG